MMRSALVLFAILFFTGLLDAQIEILNPDTLQITNIDGYRGCHTVKMKNRLDSLYEFDWKFIVPEELEENLRLNIHDFNIGWSEDYQTSCGLNRPNTFKPNSTGGVGVCINLYNEFSEDEIGYIDSMKLEFLSHPDCSKKLGGISFTKNQVLSTKFIEKETPSVFPNPVGEVLSLSKFSNEYHEFEIISLSGEILQSGKTKTNQISLNFQETGYLILRLKSNKMLFHIGFIKI